MGEGGGLGDPGGVKSGPACDNEAKDGAGEAAIGELPKGMESG